MSDAFSASVEAVINQPKSAVWDALVNPEKIKKYFFNVTVKTDWKAGSPIVYTGEWEGKPYEDKGKVVEIEDEKLLLLTHWSSLSGKEDKPENYEIVRYELFPEAEGSTKLVITQEGIKSQDGVESSKKNWQMVLDGLKKMVETPANG